MHLLFSISKNLFFDMLTEVTKAVKTSNLHLSAYVDTVEGELRSKSKSLAQQAFSTKGNGLPRQCTHWLAMTLIHSLNNCFLTVGGFFDTLKKGAARQHPFS